jgi:mediator of RNA polymerase II transcription subunit 6
MASASALPDFSPALGHTYMPPSTSKTHKSAGSQLGQASKENTPMPDSLQTSKKDNSSANNSTFLDSRLLEQSLYTHLNYGDEYMDENPITGQPGEFHLSSTGRKEKDKLMVPAARGPLQTPAKATPAPTPLKTNIPPERKGSKSEKSPKTPGMPKPKRRKSKAQGAGGISPT